MTQLVPVFNGSRDFRVLIQDLESYGIIVVHTICPTQRQCLSCFPAAFLNQHVSHPSSEVKSLNHFIRQGRPDQGDGQLDCYVKNLTLTLNTDTIHDVIAAAAQQWCTVGEPARHLAVLVKPANTRSTAFESDYQLIQKAYSNRLSAEPNQLAHASQIAALL